MRKIRGKDRKHGASGPLYGRTAVGVSPTRPTAGEVFPDGHILDIVQSEDTGRLQIVISDGVNATIEDQYEHAGKIYVPAPLDSTFVWAMRFPTHVAHAETTRKLFDDSCELFDRYLKLPATSVSVIPYFLFATWNIERLSLAPCLAVAAAHGAPVDLLLQLVGAVCRRPLVLSAVTRSGFLGLPMDYRPTLLLDELQINSGIQSLLRATARRGIFIAKGARVLDCFCAKMVCTREYLSDDVMGGLQLRIALPPVRQMALLDENTLNKIAYEFQGRFLSYRLRNLLGPSAPNHALGQQNAAAPDVAQALASCIVNDGDLQAGIITILTDQNKLRQVDAATGLQVIVLEALLLACHERDRSTLLSSEAAELANGILACRKDPTIVKPEQVGWRLRSLGFRVESIGNRGHGLYLLDDTRRRIHELALNANVRSIQAPFPGCSHCLALFRGTSDHGALSSDDLR